MTLFQEIKDVRARIECALWQGDPDDDLEVLRRKLRELEELQEETL